MTASKHHPDPVDEDISTQTPEEYHYDLRLEIGGKQAGDNVPVVAIFLDLLKRMKQAVDPETPLVILTATNKPFFEQRAIQSDEFQKAFQVDKIDGRAPRVILGFKLRTTSKLSEIKRRLMQTYLIPHSLFLREHTGGFDDGVKTSNYGFLKQDHPDHPDILALNKRFSRVTNEAWKTLNKEDKNKWKSEHPNAFARGSDVNIPINFTKERVSASVENKDKVITTALMVSTPSKYGKFLKTLLDIAVLNRKINNLIPFALSKENPEGYYNILQAQEVFMDNHRNIPISNIPPNACELCGVKGLDLMTLLITNTTVMRVSYDFKHEKYHVSTRADKYRELHQWITKTLQDHKFSYGPTIRPMKYGVGNSSATFSSVFQQAMTPPPDDTSTIKTTRSNAWKNRPPLAISYMATDVAFPPLPTTKHRIPPTPSTASETLDEDTIQSVITSALKKLEEQHRIELNQMKLDMQKKIDAVEAKMQELGKQVAIQNIPGTRKRRKSASNENGSCESQAGNHYYLCISTQLSRLINMFQSSSAILPSTDISPTRVQKRTKLNQTPMKPRNLDDAFTQDLSVSSATSTQEGDMEGCED